MNAAPLRHCIDCGREPKGPRSLRCTECAVEAHRRSQKQWEEKHRDERITYLRDWRKSNPDYYRQRYHNEPGFREAALEQLRKRRAGHARPAPVATLAQFWPYGATGWPLDEVNAAVPRSLPEVMRADVCQELCLMVLAGEIDIDGLAAAVVRTVRIAYGRWTVSLDQRHSDGWQLADRLSYEQEI